LCEIRKSRPHEIIVFFQGFHVAYSGGKLKNISFNTNYPTNVSVVQLKCEYTKNEFKIAVISNQKMDVEIDV